MGKKIDQQSKNALYAALKEHQGQTIDLSWLSEQTTISESSLGTYLGRLPAIVHSVNKENCIINPDFQLSRGEMKRLLYQGAIKHKWCHLDISELVADLLDRSKTNASLALDIINRPEQSNRVDAFLLLFMTAWEQLLKAQIAHQDEDNIYVGDTTTSGFRRTIGMKEAIERQYTSGDHPVRKNLHELRKLRNEAAHLLVSETMSILSFYFQASIFNYIEAFQTLAEEPPFGIESTGLLTFGVAYQAPTVEALAVRYGNRASEIRALIDQLEVQIRDNDDKSFAIPITYRLVMAPEGTPGAIYLKDDAQSMDALVVEKKLDPKKTHPHRATDVAKKLNTRGIRIPNGEWNTHYVAVVADYLGVKGQDSAYHYTFYNGEMEQHCYAEAFIDLIAEHVASEPDLVDKAYEQRRES